MSNSGSTVLVLSCYQDFIGEVTDMQLPQVAPRVMPQIYNIFINPQHFHIRLRCRTIEIFNSLVNTIAEMSEYDTVGAWS
jgi:hypothetical protein